MAAAVAGPDGLSMKRWLMLYGGYLLALAIPAAVMLHQLDAGWKDVLVRPGAFTAAGDQVLKLLVFAIYVSLCCTFLPLPTGWLVAALATREVALSQNVFVTTFLVASIGAAGSMVANLHDYHVFTWMLRHKWIARIRTTALYRRAGRWFARRPFWLLVIFNILPVPIDVVRMLAATYRYPLRPFAAANFVGRWIRYAVIALVTFRLGAHGWVAVVALLVVAVVLGGAKFVGQLRRRLIAAPVRTDLPQESRQ